LAVKEDILWGMMEENGGRGSMGVLAVALQTHKLLHTNS